jgi:hypothetical protein
VVTAGPPPALEGPGGTGGRVSMQNPLMKHPLADIIMFDTEHLEGKRGRRKTFLSCLNHDLRIEFPEQLIAALSIRNIEKTMMFQMENEQEKVWNIKFRRRVQHALRYFDLKLL